MREGNSYTNILGLIKEHGYNKEVHFVLATVTNPSPLEIDVNGMVVEKEDLIATETASKASFAQYDKCIVLVDGNNFFLIDKVVPLN